MKSIFLLAALIAPLVCLATDVFQVLDASSYPDNSENAMLAVVEDLRGSNKDLNELYAIANCSEKFCDIEVSLLETFENTVPIRGCLNYCVHYGYNNEHGYIVKKAHIR